MIVLANYNENNLLDDETLIVFDFIFYEFIELFLISMNIKQFITFLYKHSNTRELTLTP